MLRERPRQRILHPIQGVALRTGGRQRKLFAGCFEVSEYPSHRPRMSLAIRRFALSHDSNFSVPASSAFTRRWISLSQALAASGSAGPSRLASSSAARSVRAFALSRRASASTDSVAFVIFPDYPRGRPPNQTLQPPSRAATLVRIRRSWLARLAAEVVPFDPISWREVGLSEKCLEKPSSDGDLLILATSPFMLRQSARSDFYSMKNKISLEG